MADGGCQNCAWWTSLGISIFSFGEIQKGASLDCFPQFLLVAVLHEILLFRRPRCRTHLGRCPCRPCSRRPPSRFAKPVSCFAKFVISRVRGICFRWVNNTFGHRYHRPSCPQCLSVGHKPNCGALVRDRFESTQLRNAAIVHHCCSGNDTIKHSRRPCSPKSWVPFFLTGV